MPRKRMNRTQLKEDEFQEYAQVLRNLGERRLECLCFDGITRVCKIRGGIRLNKANRMVPDDIVLISIRDYAPDKGDIICKYTPEEVRWLKKEGHIPSTLKSASFVADTPTDIDIVFETADDDNQVVFDFI